MHRSIFRRDGKPPLERCTTCCRQFHCPLCPKTIFKPTQPARLQRHFKVHMKNAIAFEDKKICRCNLDCRNGGHYHCPICDNTIIRRADMEAHLKFCPTQNTFTSAQSKQSQDSTLYSLPPSSSAASILLVTPAIISPSLDFCVKEEPATCTISSVQSIQTSTTHSSADTHILSSPLASSSILHTVQENQGQKSKLKKVECPLCSLICLKKNLAKHIQRKHPKKLKDVTQTGHLKSVCVDGINGISAVQKGGRGFSVPIHVQNKTWGRVHKVQCDLEECNQYSKMASRSGLTFTHCEHIRSLRYCTDIATEECLREEMLTEMVRLKFFGDQKMLTCIKRQEYAQAAHVPLCVEVSFEERSKHFCFSVHEPTFHYYSRLGRIFVTYNSSANTWHCPCAKPRMSCVHKNISKWHLFQTNRDVLRTEEASTPKKHEDPVYPPSAEVLERLVEYIYRYKNLPSNLPDDVIRPKALTDYLTVLQPVETVCVLCPRPVNLEESARISRKARIITMNGVIENVSTYFRRCPVCHMTYRYQEWQDGLHNFDDHTILTLELCVYLRLNLQNNVSISKVLNALEGLRKVQIPAKDKVLHAYCHFEALTSHDYSFSCVCCGYHPPVVIMDFHKKEVFNFPVSGIKDPPENFTGEVNIEEFWDSVQLEMISRSFVQSCAKNSFSVRPSFEHWGPWIGKNTRKSEMGLNTEFEKASSTEAEVSMVSEDWLLDELMKQKVSNLRKLCKACNLDAKGSRIDLILRLRQEMKTQHSYDKIFQKIWGASGGWSVILCPHGVVYSLKFNLRAESPRDFADLLLSWKHLPNVSVYGFARGLATHVNLRWPTVIPFKPHEGRLAASSPHNITAAQQNKLKISLPWLTEMLQNPDKDGHPCTGSSDHYVLYDKFHEANTNDPQEVLRRINLVPELQGSLNSQLAEQLFSCMRKNNYFLNNMAPSMHVFLMRNLIHHRNNNINAQLLEKQL